MIFSAHFFSVMIFLRSFTTSLRILRNISAGFSNQSTCPQEHLDESFQKSKSLHFYRLSGNLSEKCSDLHENASGGFSEHSTFPEDETHYFFQ